MEIKEINIESRLVGDRIIVGDPLNIIDYPILYKKYSVEKNKILYFYANSEVEAKDVLFRDKDTNTEIKYKCFGRIDHISDMVLQLLSNKKILITDTFFSEKKYEGNYGESLSEIHKEVFLKHGYLIDLVSEEGFDFLEKNKDLIVENLAHNNNIISNKFCVIKLKKDTYFKLISIDGIEHLIYFDRDKWNILENGDE